jgi:hypothetical protein
MSWFKIVGTEKITPILFLGQLVTCRLYRSGQDEILKAATWLDIMKQLGGLTIPHSSGRQRIACATAVLDEMSSKAVRKYVMLLRTFVGNQGFNGFSKSYLVTFCTGSNKIKK